MHLAHTNPVEIGNIATGGAWNKLTYLTNIGRGIIEKMILFTTSYIKRLLRLLEEIVSERSLGEFLFPHCGRVAAALHQVAEERSHD